MTVTFYDEPGWVERRQSVVYDVRHCPQLTSR
jgi:hypothetical protein